MAGWAAADEAAGGEVHDAVGEQLLRAASDVLATEGAAALTVRRIATEAGVSTMNVYSRFGGKDGIVEHLWVEGFNRLRDATTSVPETDDPIADLRGCGVAYRRFALANPTYYAVMFDRIVPFEPSGEAVVHAVHTLRLLADRLARAMQMGAMPRADPMHTAGAVWATCHGVVSLELKDVGPSGLDWDRVYTTATEALLVGLLSRGDSATKTSRGRPAG